MDIAKAPAPRTLLTTSVVRPVGATLLIGGLCLVGAVVARQAGGHAPAVGSQPAAPSRAAIAGLPVDARSALMLAVAGVAGFGIGRFGRRGAVAPLGKPDEVADTVASQKRAEAVTTAEGQADARGRKRPCGVDLVVAAAQGGAVGSVEAPCSRPSAASNRRLADAPSPHSTDLGIRGRSGAGPGTAERRLLAGYAGRSVLVAEDNPLNCEVAKELLIAVGLRVDTASNGAEAIALAQARRYDLLLMDVRMPGVDGLEATRLWRRGEVGPRLPIVAMTACAFSDDRAACLAHGMDDHLAKPVVPEQLYAMLLRWLPPPTGATAPFADAAPAPAAVVPPPLGAAPPRVDGGSASQGLVERLGDVEGLDVFAALRNVGGQAHVLAHVLEHFVASYGIGEPSLLDAPSANSLARWKALCHSIRGAAATIGASEIAGDALTLEHRLRNGAQASAVTAEAKALHEALKVFSGRLANALHRVETV